MNRDLPGRNETLSFEKRAKDLVARMTLEEKVSQMRNRSPAIGRLGVPAYDWWCEALHGVARAGTATVFPQAIGMAATFDEGMVEKAAEIISTEGRAKFNEFQRKGDRGIYKGLTFWSPNVNLFRDPRWGRGQETYGEDPYLTALLGRAFVRGIQGRDKRYWRAAACAKHFAAHSGPEGERHRFNAVVSPKDLRETYLPAFRALAEEGVAGFMGAYNRLNGEPCCGSRTLLRDILRDEWGFRGYVTSDCGAVGDFHGGHGVTADAKESAALALASGCDIECGDTFANLARACREGLVSGEEIDRAVVRLMTVRMRLGLFDDPARVPFAKIPYEKNDCPEHRDYALQVSKKSLVLLKNDGLLPLDRGKIGSIAVVGPNADSRAALVGNYCGTPSESVTVLEGIREAVGSGTRVYYAQGCHLYRDRVEPLADARDRISEAVSAAERADAVVLCLGLDATLEGEEGDTTAACGFASGDKPDLDLPAPQRELMEAVAAAGRPVILVLLAGSALAVGWADEHLPVVVQAWYPGAQGGRAVAALIFGDYSPSGRLPVTFYRTTGELPDFRDYSMKNRTYRYMEQEALYPFGYGLGYTAFEYGAIGLSAEKIPVGDFIDCSVLVRNAGDREGDEVVQLYLKDVMASVEVPKWQLCGVRVVHLKPGEEKRVAFAVTPRQMALIDEDGNCILEPGVFEVFLGGSQPDRRSEELTGRAVPSAFFKVLGESRELAY